MMQDSQEMRGKLLLSGFVFALSIHVPIHAEQIVLRDGSRIQGEVLSMTKGVYRIQSPSLGVIDLPADRIRSITKGTIQPQQAPAAAGSPAVQSLQATMAQDQDIMSRILRLRDDADMQAVLQDPELMQAIQSFELKAVADHPKIKRLMNNQDIRDIQGKLN